MPNIRVFIYGTLLPGQCNHSVVSSFITSWEPGEIAGRMVDCGPYPAAVRDGAGTGEASTIQGLWITVSREGLAAMDALEEFAGIEELNDYERVWRSDRSKPDVQGWTYMWESDRGYPWIKGSYWPDYMAGKERNE
ncbi:gamma-glutamylcyclotransferase family protein [Paenibacillus sp. PL2-23]|uniref:gamma-glutamylcyclotransferase family protein n=1 Tax=Paenibacillus sp. PL2-23 TaxID=2100729 RepID=UPI0030F70E39